MGWKQKDKDRWEPGKHISAHKNGDLAWQGRNKSTGPTKEWNLIVMSGSLLTSLFLSSVPVLHQREGTIIEIAYPTISIFLLPTGGRKL
jgi:hypothetical protein